MFAYIFNSTLRCRALKEGISLSGIQATTMDQTAFNANEAVGLKQCL